MFENLTDRFEGIFKKLSGNAKLSEKNIEEGLREVRTALLEADVSLPVVRDFVNEVQERALGEEVIRGINPTQQFIKVVEEELAEFMGGEAQPIPWQQTGPTVILLAGLQGAGKTTTAGKLAVYLRDNNNKRPLLVAADLQRPAAIEQLKVIGGQIGVDVFHEPGITSPELCGRAIEYARKNMHDLVILDSAGRLHVDDELMDELLQVCEKTKPHQIYMVLDSMTGQDAVRSAEAFDSQLAIDGVILTKMDGDARGGAALSVKHVTQKPIRFIGTGENMEALEAFHPDRIAGRILGMGDITSLVEQAEQKLDQEKAEKLEKQMMKGRFTFEMFLDQMEQLKKLGSMKSVLGMLPGIGSKLKDIDIPEDELRRIKGIILSMTPHERRVPDLISGNRKQRIAKGSGVQVSEVNDLMKRFKQMQKMMKSFTGRMKGMLGGMGANEEMSEDQMAALATGEGRSGTSRAAKNREKARKRKGRRKKR